MDRAAKTAVALLALAALPWSASAGGASAASAVTTLNLALRDASRHSAFRVAESSLVLGRAYVSAADVAANEGRQRITISPGWQVRVEVVGGVAYLAGNQAGLIHYFGFPTAAARKAGSRWVSIPASNPGYAPASQNVLEGPVLTYLTPSGHLTETAPAKIGGTAVIGISGTGPALRPGGAASSLTLFVARVGAPLPVRAVFADKQGDHETVTLSSWDEPVAVKAPRGAIGVAALAHTQ